MKHLLLTTIAAVVLVGAVSADPIHDAAWDGDLDGVQAELDKGADVNAKDWNGYTPLYWAAFGGHKEIVELLIAKGADLNAKDDKYGRTPLRSAAIYDHKEIAEILIAEGANVNAKDERGKTPLDLAIQVKNPKTAALLRKHGGKTGEELKAEGK